MGLNDSPTALTAVVSSNGNNFSAWESVSVQQDFGSAIQVFEFSPVEGGLGSFKLDVGDPVQIYLAGQLALTGVVTTRTVGLDKQSKQIVIAGRSTQADAESSIDIKPGNYNGYSIQQAANAVLKQVNLQASFQNAGDAVNTPFAKLAPHYGETIIEFVQRLAMLRGLFITGDVDGRSMVFSQKQTDSSSSCTFSEGQNIISLYCKMDNQGVAGAYRAVSTMPGTDQNWPARTMSASVIQPAGRANFLNMFVAEHPMSADELKGRVQHENAVSTWTAFECNIVINGWLDPSGKLWNPLSSTRVSVYSPSAFPRAPYMVECGIQGVTFRQDQSGSTTNLKLTLPNLLTGSATSGASVGQSAAPDAFGGDDATNAPASVDPGDTQT